MATTTSPCEGCDHVTTTYDVNEGHNGDDKSQSSLSTGEIQSTFFRGKSITLYKTEIEYIERVQRKFTKRLPGLNN